MSISIGNYPFDGPFASTDDLRALSGVYVVLGRDHGQQWNVVDVGESAGVYARVGCHDRAPRWASQRYDQIAYAAYYCGEADRMRIEGALRQQYNPPCGDR